jgi:hypothetical protein
MYLKESEWRNDCAVTDQQQYNWPTEASEQDDMEIP